MSTLTIDQILQAIPQEAVPKNGTRAYEYLMTLLRNYPADTLEEELNKLFKGRQRSPLQSLMGDQNYYWQIEPVFDESGLIVARRLDSRHCSGNTELDTCARRERRKKFKEESYKQAKQGRTREPRALREREAAQAEYLMSLGDAANDSNNKSKKPSSD